MRGTRKNVGLIVNRYDGYGFPIYNWTLVVGSRKYFLGQDVKFCVRGLSMQPRGVMGFARVEEIKVDAGDRGNNKLANFIIDMVFGEDLSVRGINSQNHYNWTISAE